MSALSPGQLVGRYRIEQLIGTGGMGEVYRAFDTVLRRAVALKFIAREARSGERTLTPDQHARFMREARAAAGLRHPGIVTIFDVGELDGAPYIAMELIEGTPLSAFRGADVALERKLRWLGQIAGALAEAHRAGLVHRDVKPENVMVCDDDSIRILDFGVAKLAEVEVPSSRRADEEVPSFRTGFGAVVGTPRYMAPEQAAGLTVDARADQFAWGLVAYELIAGQPAGDVEKSFTVEANWEKAADPIGPRCPELPAALTDVVMRALERRVGARFATMEDVTRAFAPYAAAPATPHARPSPSDSVKDGNAHEEPGTGSTVSMAGSALARVAPHEEPRPARSWRVLAALAVVGLAGAPAIAWRARRPAAQVQETRDASTTCSYELLADTALETPSTPSLPWVWTAGAAGPVGVAMAVAWPEESNKQVVLRVLADASAVTARRVDLGDLGPLAGVDVAWLTGEAHAFTVNRFVDSDDGRILVDFPFARDRFGGSARVGGPAYCRNLPGRPTTCPYQLRGTQAGFDEDAVSSAFTPVGVTVTVEKDGAPSIRVFGVRWQGSQYFLGAKDHPLHLSDVEGVGASLAVAFLYDEHAYAGRLADTHGPRALARKADQVALTVDGDTLHVLYSGDGRLTHARWPSGGEPEEHTSKDGGHVPTALQLAAQGERLWAAWVEGGRASIGSGAAIDDVVRNAVRIAESQPRDGPWVSAGAGEALVVWLEDGPLRIRRARARCP